MSASEQNSERSFETKAIYTSQICGEWGHNEIVPPIVTSATFYLEDPTDANVWKLEFFQMFIRCGKSFNFFFLLI